MKLYLDASALAKVFLAEEGRGAVVEALSVSSVPATSRLTYVEVRTALSRAVREGRLARKRAGTIVRAFDERWGHLLVVDLDQDLAARAADLASHHPLRAADAIHLASALLIATGDPATTLFACFDARLSGAARAVGFEVLPAAGSGSAGS